ncbi:MAG: TauD/TfdA family dioxygenase [Acidimicrobiales bacterium]|nr:TauD/TfdA family dioxygenase [Acidimicrobiales bacterium]
MSTTPAVEDPVPLETHCEWATDELGERYVRPWTDDELAELEAAVDHASRACDDVLDVAISDFPLPTLGPRLAACADELINGRGVVLFRGWPVERFTREQNEIAYWGVGTHLGEPWPQNARGHLLGDVTDQGKDPNDPNSRGYEVGGVGLPFHSDGSDLVGLFCLDPGNEGGRSLVANAVAAHNEMVREAPELAVELYQPLPYDYRGEQREGGKAWYMVPVFQRWGDRLFVRYIRPFIDSSQRHPDAPRLSNRAIEAMNRFEALCADGHRTAAMQLQRGDMQFIDNYHVVHGRERYSDAPDEGRVRHLKRLWLETRVLTDDDKPERFRMARSASHWWKGRQKDTFAAQRD